MKRTCVYIAGLQASCCSWAYVPMVEKDGLYSSGAEREHKEQLFLVPQSVCPASACNFRY